MVTIVRRVTPTAPTTRPPLSSSPYYTAQGPGIHIKTDPRTGAVISQTYYAGGFSLCL